MRPFAVLVIVAGLASPAMSFAQGASVPAPVPRQLASVTPAELQGVVLDERAQPLPGAVISAVGGTSAFAVSDRNGRFTLHDLPVGPYLVRAHLQGYAAARDRIVQVSTATRNISLSLTKVAAKDDQPEVLQAGVAGVTEPAVDDNDEGQPSDIAWRLRHARQTRPKLLTEDLRATWLWTRPKFRRKRPPLRV